MTVTERKDVEALLANFADYVNPEGDEDPWFTLDEINQQFAWENIPESTLKEWLSDLVIAGKVALRDEGEEREWRWLF